MWAPLHFPRGRDTGLSPSHHILQSTMAVGAAVTACGDATDDGTETVYESCIDEAGHEGEARLTLGFSQL